MKTALLVSLVFLAKISLGQVTYTFNSEYIYKMTYNPDTSDRARVKEEYMELLVCDTASLFRSVKSGSADSVKQHHHREGIPMRPFREAPSLLSYTIIKKQDKISYIDYQPEYNPNVIYYIEKPDDFMWEIQSATDTQLGFSCQSAQINYGGRTWTAWFTPDIPLMDGPYKFGYLPGLIVKLTSSDSLWNFSLVSNRSVKREVSINKYPERKKEQLTRAGFHKSYNYFLENKLLMDIAAGKISFPTPEDRAAILSNYQYNVKRNSNRIELHP